MKIWLNALSLIILSSTNVRAEDPPVAYGAAPIVAYTPTYGLIVGAAAFVYPKEGRQGLDSRLIAAFLPGSGQANVSFARENEWSDRWGYALEGNYNDFFTSYYGEGDRTSRISQDFEQNFYRAHAGLRYLTPKTLVIETFVETRSRHDRGLQDAPAIHLTEDETRTIAGVLLTHDTRDSLVNTRVGHFASAQVHTTVSAGTTPAFQQLELEYRHFVNLSDKYVLGVRGEFATTNGSPSYNFAYNLGGIERLRGYLHNRFRGSQYYLAGSEIRRDLWRDYLQAVAFADIGDIKAGQYDRPRPAAGVGIRFGLPPDWGMKFRLDIAFGDDQQGFFATFGQAF